MHYLRHLAYKKAVLLENPEFEYSKAVLMEDPELEYEEATADIYV
jgi:hypothetical protein